eukprot:TRINITY_DN3431_c0_g1_i1.p1 TRINITY_DN3431_c0_g1~~TRINITY_DN3431_c0_g1_i1.p1  ORF type:complete len:742 (+),score=369.18 TRINITY_DN3431_c0_g1_i1:122-2347(+)
MSASFSSKINYPNTRRDDSILDDYNGTKVADPYRWLEDPDAEETKEFVKAQNLISSSIIDSSPIRKPFIDRMTELYDYPKFGVPFKEGQFFYYWYNTGLQQQSSLYVQRSVDEEGVIFFDPNILSTDGTISYSGGSFSEDGSLFAYKLSQSGSDWNTIHISRIVPTEIEVDVEVEEDGTKKIQKQKRILPKKEDLSDKLSQVKFSSLSWTHDNLGFFYNKYDAGSKADGTETDQNLFQKLYYHRLGEDQSKDILCAEFPDYDKWMSGAQVTKDGKYLLLTPSEGCDPVNRLFFCDLTKLPEGKIHENLPFVKIVDNFDAEYDYITNDGSQFIFKTNLSAPKYKLITIDFENYQQENWKDLVSESEEKVLEWATVVCNDKLVVCYLQDVKNVVELFTIEGSHVETIPTEIGSVVGFSGKKEEKEIFFKLTSFLRPSTIYGCDLALSSKGIKVNVIKDTPVKGVDTSSFTTEQVFYPSKDGTKIPMFIVSKKGRKNDGSHPVLLYGYGGFNISLTPGYSVSRLVFVEHLGGILAIPNIRGGGEYGEKWHKAGSLLNKQNCFDDFQCAAEYLIEKGYTSPKKIAINGGSNGGLLVGACVNQRPDLFGCAIAQVGVLDMLRFHKFTIGHAWTTDYGSSDEAKYFDYLHKYSPYHNVSSEKQYPAVLVMTGDHDDRVVPLHSLKFIAALQHAAGKSGSTAPLVARIDTKSGHGAGKPTKKQIEEASDMYSFLAEAVGARWEVNSSL